METSPILSASEVEKFGYCPLSWWLSRRNAQEETEDLELGEEKHDEIAHEVRAIKLKEERARESETIVLYFAIAATIISTLGITFFHKLVVDIGEIMGVIALIWLLAACYFLYKAETLVTSEDRMISERITLGFAMVATLIAVYAVTATSMLDRILSRVLQVAALAWLMGASFFFHRCLKHLEEASALRREQDLQEGTIEYVDARMERPKMFESKRWGLRGRPDFVLLTEESHIPVEVKTGRTPRGPLFSHILQIAAYCLLIEDEYGVPPPYGLLKYEGAQHEIEFNEDMRKLLLEKLDEMRTVSKTGEVHRNHNRPGKCANCSRRLECPERLV